MSERSTSELHPAPHIEMMANINLIYRVKHCYCHNVCCCFCRFDLHEKDDFIENLYIVLLCLIIQLSFFNFVLI